MITAQSPMRITIAGGGTDLPVFYRRHGGMVISAAIDKYVTVKAEAGTYFGTCNYHDLDEKYKYALAAGWTPGSGIQVKSDVEPGSGLGGSAALMTALIKAKDPQISPLELGHAAYFAERYALNHATGLQDAFSSAYGGAVRIVIEKTGQCFVSHVKLPEEVKKSIVLFNTGTQRRASRVLEDRVNAIESSISSEDEMLEIDDIGERIRADLEHNSGKSLGSLFNNHWEAKKGILKSHTNDQIDKWHEIAMNNGAEGGKVSGAGAGGHMVFVCKPNNQLRLIESLANAGMTHVPFKFVEHGCRVINE